MITRVVLGIWVAMLICNELRAQTANECLQKGWQLLVSDKDGEALQWFERGYEQAKLERNKGYEAEALLKMGICTHGSSHTKGLEYANRAMATYQQLETTRPEWAAEGRAKCLQLIASIYGRQGNYRAAVNLSKQALTFFQQETDSLGYIGLICSSLATAYQKLNLPDSATYFDKLSLTAQLQSKNVAYLPTSYLRVGEMELNKGNAQTSWEYFQKAYHIADSTHNQQGKVACLLALGKWQLRAANDEAKAETYFQQAKQLSSTLNDKSFLMRSLKELLTLRQKQGNFEQAFTYQSQMMVLKDTIHHEENANQLKRLEVEFQIAEKDRQMALIQKEKSLATTINYLLFGLIALILMALVGVVVFMRKINQRDKELLATQTELAGAQAQQQQMKQTYLQNELEYKESQLSALTLQMIQKNELLQELKTQLETMKTSDASSLQKIIQKSSNQDQEWEDFNSHFQSINKNFYSRLKAAYPDISPNDLKICALIKMNLSIKEMASILNISPDSVKTARYRLRKKLQLQTEDNLTDFILAIT